MYEAIYIKLLTLRGDLLLSRFQLREGTELHDLATKTAQGICVRLMARQSQITSEQSGSVGQGEI